MKLALALLVMFSGLSVNAQADETDVIAGIVVGASVSSGTDINPLYQLEIANPLYQLN